MLARDRSISNVDGPPRVGTAGPQPLKHRRYPETGVRAMTIAAGFRCLDGVLIGADSRLESGDIKYDEDKTFMVPSKQSGFVVVITGAGDFEAIQHCVYLLDGSFFKNCDGSLPAIAGEIRKGGYLLDSGIPYILWWGNSGVA